MKRCQVWLDLEQRAPDPESRKQLRMDLGRIFNTTIGKPLSLRMPRGQYQRPSRLSRRIDILRGALSTRWLDLRRGKSLTEYYADGSVLADRIQPFLRPRDRVLEYGVGIGRIATHLAPHCLQISGCDINPKMVQYGSLLCPDVRFCLLDDLAPEPQFDFCYSVAVFFHLDPEAHDAALSYVHQRLTKQGRFLVDLILKDLPRPVSRWRGSVSYAGREEFTALCARYFEIEPVSLFNDAFLLTKR